MGDTGRSAAEKVDLGKGSHEEQQGGPDAGKEDAGKEREDEREEDKTPPIPPRPAR